MLEIKITQTITVNMADGSSEMTTDGGAELAKAIDAAVQTTIEKNLDRAEY